MNANDQYLQTRLNIRQFHRRRDRALSMVKDDANKKRINEVLSKLK